MAKPRKKKSGFHKDISSILKGVPIPQGVRNWRPPDKSDPVLKDESYLSAMSNVSSVFKGVPVEPDFSQSTYAESKHLNHDFENSFDDAPDTHQVSQSSLMTELDSPDDFHNTEHDKKLATDDRIAYYQDPFIDESLSSVAEQLQVRPSYLQKCFGKKGRKTLILLVPVLIVIILLVYRYCF